MVYLWSFLSLHLCNRFGFYLFPCSCVFPSKPQDFHTPLCTLTLSNFRIPWYLIRKKALVSSWKSKWDLGRVDDGTLFFQSSLWFRLRTMISGWLHRKFSSEEDGNFWCRPLCPHMGQTGTVLNFKVSIIKRTKNNKNLTGLTFAVVMAGSLFLFIAKVVNILRNFFLFLKAPGL